MQVLLNIVAMNSRKHGTVWTLTAFSIYAAACVIGFLLGSGRWTFMIATLILGTFWPCLLVLLDLRVTRKFSAARAAGLTPCSGCDYPLDLKNGTVRCPECGCKRTAAEHTKAWNNWWPWEKAPPE